MCSLHLTHSSAHTRGAVAADTAAPGGWPSAHLHFLVSCFFCLLFTFSSWQYPIDSLWGSGLVSLLASQTHQHHGHLTNFWCFCGLPHWPWCFFPGLFTLFPTHTDPDRRGCGPGVPALWCAVHQRRPRSRSVGLVTCESECPLHMTAADVGLVSCEWECPLHTADCCWGAGIVWIREQCLPDRQPLMRGWYRVNEWGANWLWFAQGRMPPWGGGLHAWTVGFSVWHLRRHENP